mmetsp:Transcript_137314/g.325253  ORF Transcript_137314/g.325253 Transcript_137314/m.325253 type:complete len:89 (-) Transcript_137314:1591-1857(-)
MLIAVAAVPGLDGLLAVDLVPRPASGKSKKEPPIFGDTGRCTSFCRDTLSSEGWLPGVVALVLLVEELNAELPLFNDTPVPGGVSDPA